VKKAIFGWPKGPSFELALEIGFEATQHTPSLWDCKGNPFARSKWSSSLTLFNTLFEEQKNYPKKMKWWFTTNNSNKQDFNSF
jgi:hypothetical protein